MITLFSESSSQIRKRPTNLKINLTLVDSLRRAEALGVWLYLRVYNERSTADRDSIRGHFKMELETLNGVLDYLVKERAIKVEKDTITALEAQEAKEYTIPISINSKHIQKQ